MRLRRPVNEQDLIAIFLACMVATMLLDMIISSLRF
jgi:hypothetical protein